MTEDPSDSEPKISLIRFDRLGRVVTPPHLEPTPASEAPATHRFSSSLLRAESTIVPPPISTEFETSSRQDAQVEDSQLADAGLEESRQPTKPTGSRSSDAISQSFILMASMTVMLLAARFVIPSVVEEIRYAWHRGQLRAQYESASDGLKNVSLDTLSQAYQMVTSVVGPSVVHIDVERGSIGPEDFAGSGARGALSFPASDQGSGIVLDEQGHLLTNRHVIAEGSEIIVTLSDGRRRTASVVGTDELTDLAVLKISADKLIPIKWGDSDQCNVGSPVWAVGSPFGLDRTVTFGILSGKHRMVRASTQYQDFMQSDVAVNPGNSGGPLVDTHGELVGVNTAIVGDTYQGVSFSIPSNVAKQIFERLRDVGQVQRAWLGVALTEVPDERLVGENSRVRGAMVSGLTGETAPAAKAGVRSGDLILSLQNQPIRDVSHLMQMIGGSLAGEEVKLKVLRGQDELLLPVRLEARPEFVRP
jgi:serine protease Do